MNGILPNQWFDMGECKFVGHQFLCLASEITNEISSIGAQMSEVKKQLTGNYNLPEIQELLDKYSGLQEKRIRAQITLNRKFPNPNTYPAPKQAQMEHEEEVQASMPAKQMHEAHAAMLLNDASEFNVNQ